MNKQKIEARNPQYTENGLIDLEYKHPEYGWIPYTSDEKDVEAISRELFRRAESGEYGKVKPYTPYVPTESEVATEVRAKRDRALRELDPIVSNPLRWADLTESEQEALKVYRQALLDIPEQPEFPFEVEFPDKPKLMAEQ